jgi:hypothetical protein
MSPSIPDKAQITVRRIKQFSFYMNEMLFAQKQSEKKERLVKIEIAIKLSFTIETNLVFLMCRVFYHVPESSEQHNVIADIQVQNVFEVSDLKQFQINPSEILLPPSAISTIVGLSISHTRALLANNIAGTLIQENLIDIIDSTHLAKHFFPKMFEAN